MKPKVNIYVISDNHFGHWNINRYCKRGFQSLDQMDLTMLKRWNSTVTDNDLVIHLGDFVFTKGDSVKVANTIKSLKGRKALIKGNHDRKSYSWYLNNGIDFICERMVWRWGNKRILFIHNPNNIKYTDFRDYDLIIHGHWHEKGTYIYRKRNCLLINVSVEKINYIPKRLVTLVNLLGNKRPKNET